MWNCARYARHSLATALSLNHQVQISMDVLIESFPAQILSAWPLPSSSVTALWCSQINTRHVPALLHRQNMWFWMWNAKFTRQTPIGDTPCRFSSPYNGLRIMPMPTVTVKRLDTGVVVLVLPDGFLPVSHSSSPLRSAEFNHCLVGAYNFKFNE